MICSMCKGLIDGGHGGTTKTTAAPRFLIVFFFSVPSRTLMAVEIGTRVRDVAVVVSGMVAAVWCDVVRLWFEVVTR